MGREEYGEGKELLKSRSILYHIIPPPWSMVEVVLWGGHEWLPMGLVPLYLLMMWLLTKAAGWILKCLGIYYLLRFSQMQPKLIGWRFIVQMDPKHTAKATQLFFKANLLQWPSQSPDLNLIEHAFHLLKAKCPKNKQELKTAAVKAWQSITREETQHLVYGFQTSGSHWLQRICNQVLKLTI